MAAIISIAVGAIGTMVGTAIGAAIGGTILGISAATIGGIIGAGLAGGVLSWAKGGDFGKGFLMGAAGGAIGAFAKAGIGAMSSGAGEAAGGVAEGAAAGAEGAATTGTLEGIGTTSGLEGVTSAGAEGAATGATEGGFSMDALTGGTGLTSDAAATAVPGETGGFSLGAATAGDLDSYGLGASTFDTGATTQPTGGLNNMAQNQGNMVQGNMNTPTTGGFNADPTSSTYGLTDSSKLMSADYGSTPTAAEGFGTAPEAGSYSMSYDQGTGAPVGGGSMLEKSDNWLGENLGMKSGSTAKLAKGGLEYLYKNYQTDKLAREVNKLKPMTFEEYASQFSDPGAYRTAAATMAKGGRTGTLPALLARMRNETRGKYAGYLQPQQERYLAGQSGIANQRTQNMGGLLSTLGSTGMGM